MINFRLNQDKVFKQGYSEKAKQLKREGKKIPRSYYNPKESAIYISCSYGGYIKVNTGLKIQPADFDVSTQSVKTRDQRSIELQLLLNDFKDQCMIRFMKIKREGKKLTKEDVKILMESVVNGDSSLGEFAFFDIFDQFVEWKSKHVVEKTIKVYYVLRRYLQEFEHRRRRTLSIHGIDNKLIEEFVDFLIMDKNLVQNTYTKYVKQLKGFGRFCLLNDYSENEKYKQIKASEHATSVFVLSIEELERFAALKFAKGDSLREVRDVFLALAYTGQRYSDIKEMRWKDVVKEGEYYYWNLFQSKTRDVLATRIPLLPEAMELINARKGKPEDLVFNVISNQKMNTKLKDIARLAKITGEFTIVRKQGHVPIKIVKKRVDCVTTHIGRKSFITNAIVRGMSPELIRRISGHSDAQAMRPYINISEKHVAEQLLSTHSRNIDKSA